MMLGCSRRAAVSLSLRNRASNEGVPGVERLQDLHRDRRPVDFAAHEHPRHPSLADQALEVVGAKGLTHEIGGRAGHGFGALQKWLRSV